MKISKKRKLIITICICFYIAGYFKIRYEKILIHRVTFRTNFSSGKVTYYHHVARGDFGIPIFGSIPFIWIIGDVCALIYFPLMIGESIVWYIIPREYM